MGDLTAYTGLFLSALVAATLLPAQSESVLAGLLLLGEQPAWALLAIATLGNVLGSLINWLLGRGLLRWRQHRRAPFGERALARAERHYRRYGYWSLLLSWAPLIGDPLTLIAGTLGEPLWRFLLLVTLAKGGRYLLLAAVVNGVVALPW